MFAEVLRRPLEVSLNLSRRWRIARRLITCGAGSKNANAKGCRCAGPQLRAWQGLLRRFKAPCHRLAALNTQESEGGTGTGWRVKEGRVEIIDFFVSPFLAKTAAWVRLVGRHRVQKRS